MKVSPLQPFQIVYSLLDHEFLGYLIEAFVVQRNSRGELTLQNQTLSTQNVSEFAKGLDERDFELVKLIDSIQQDTIVKKFNSRKLPAVDFFLKIYDAQKGDKQLQEAIGGYLETIKAQIMALLPGKPFYIMGNDGNPAWQPIIWMAEPARVHFHFVRNADSTHYFPIIRYPRQNAAGEVETERVDFQFKDALMICDEPAYMMVGNRLYHFSKNVDGKKLRPFFTKNHIVIPRNIEQQYYERFVTQLIASYDVYAKGFEIRAEVLEPTPVLTVSEVVQSSRSVSVSLFQNGGTDGIETLERDEDADPRIVFDLAFQYGNFTFRFDSFGTSANVSLEKKGDEYLFHKIRRDQRLEKQKLTFLRDSGLDLRHGRVTLSKSDAFAWLSTNNDQLREAGFLVRQDAQNTKRYFLGYSSIDVSIQEGRDWFDIYANVRFGEYEIPFLKLRKLILAKKREFTLPNGEVAVIPSAWFTKYSELFGFIEHLDGIDSGDGRLVLQKHHLALVEELDRDNLATTVISRKLERLRNFEEIEHFPLPVHFNGTLRPYQQAGYDWMNFLRQYRFGGCLADDMGLGKTVMTLAMLQNQKELGATEPSLLVMPTSLLYNWELEARKFTPDLRIMVYTGTYRDKNTAQFDGYDLILTSYGIVRIDIDSLSDYRFNYVILDESQAIKNPSSHITRAVMQLNTANRLILTGTPLENSTMDLWSQMSFINPGLLGSQSFFRNEFQVPIEKRHDEAKTSRLYSLIKPFMLRRNKAQVATDLPEKVESVLYCEMTPDQEAQYEEAKSYYRNLILEHIEEEGMAKSQMVVLQGLTKLRQIANHPRMVDAEYEGDSGKLDDVIMRLESAMTENHKVLVFSQFIKHLNVVQHYLKEKRIKYAYLDGSTTDRQSQVALFQTDDSVKLFLISLKAGGLGHNLTAADYVFILDPWWNPAIEAQAVDRAHRIGQQKTVFTYKFIAKNTVEEKILSLQRAKQQLAGSLITTEENFVKSLTKEDIMVLLE
ncbi:MULTISPECIES: DEAD/DEAH box helicase [unclassified Spirosoma]|uniref:DEAD/DEAH box helicase n=1 Tax=unclassified Spirosoma TaxID=2621999 RepID=UPI000958EBBE|nr:MULTISPECIES: DEAD/DEAH box helicase [unclassified Spirosoma]MBN8824859.1 DEAD/DEAH box helicase [Spirosoma sp.]OJW76994.1 MAG: helicase SNF2 [Spirosoma sp. 48-14]